MNESKVNTYRRLLGYLKPYRKQMLLAYVTMALGTLAKLFIPQAVESAIDNGLAQNDSTVLIRSGLVILGLALISGTVSFLYFYYGHWLSHRVAYDLRNDLYNAVQEKPFAFHDLSQTGDLMSRATSDIQEARWFVGIRLAELVSIMLTVTGTIGFMLYTFAEVALIGLIPIPILAFATIRFARIVRPMFKKLQEQLGTLSNTMQESMTGIRVVKAFAREPWELEKFDRDNMAWYHGRVSLVTKWANNWPMFVFLTSSGIFLLLFYGGPRAITGAPTTGEMYAMISYITMLLGPIQGLGFIVNLAATAGSAAGRVFEIMDQPNLVADRPDPTVFDPMRGEVVFDDVTFGYAEDRPILHNISFTAQPGETVAIVGPTGAGKSTIINLLPRFYEQQSGRITVDGVDIRDAEALSLRRNIGTVQQNSFLFSSTIGDNIRYGRPTATDEEVIAAAKAAQAHDFILRFPDGYKTMVGERGVTLSGGQKQRVAIARTLLTNPAILVLDDATSSVDTETEHQIQQALKTLMQNRTTFVIAQRLLTLKHADKILVLDHGRIVERGTHNELLAQHGLYRDIYDLQLRDQEEFAKLAANIMGGVA